MGNNITKKQQTIKVATINFNGVQYSPFEYYSQQHYVQEEQLNSIFEQKFKEHKNIFTNDIMQVLKKMDQKIKEQRYSPLYNKLCGISDGRFLNEGFFNTKWWTTFQATFAWKKLLQNIDPSQQTMSKIRQNQLYQEIKTKFQKHLQALCKFDYLVYITILQYVYQSDQIQNIIKERSCSKYIGFMAQFFGKSALNQNKKILYAIDFIEKQELDVCFMQEVTNRFCIQFQRTNPNYRIILSPQDPKQPGRSAVVFKQSSFSKASIGRKGNLKLLQILNDTKLTDQRKKSFLKWGKLAFISIDNFILISTKSAKFKTIEKKKDKNKQKANNQDKSKDVNNNLKKQQSNQQQNLQAKILQDLMLIRQKFPNKYLIVGGVIHQIQSLIANTNVKKPQKQLTKQQIQQQLNRRKRQTQKQKQEQKKRKTWQFFQVFPQNIITCYKTRTAIQFMVKKANKQIKQQNNFILFDRRLKLQEDDKNGVFDIKGQSKYFPVTVNIKTANKIKKKLSKLVGLLPSQDHPFDQLIPIKTLRIPLKKKKQLSQDQLIIDKKNKQRLGFQTSSSQEQVQK